MDGTVSRQQRGREVSLSAFGLVFSEIVQYHTRHIETAGELETKLEDVGFALGRRFFEFIVFREVSWKRNASEVAIVQYISSTCWKALFGKNADSLERSTEREREYMIYDKRPLTNYFISVPRELGSLDCAAFIAGLATGMLDAAGFIADVRAHTVTDSTVFLVQFFSSLDELNFSPPENSTSPDLLDSNASSSPTADARTEKDE